MTADADRWYSDAALAKQAEADELLARDAPIPTELLCGMFEPRVQPTDAERCVCCGLDARDERGGEAHGGGVRYASGVATMSDADRPADVRGLFPPAALLHLEGRMRLLFDPEDAVDAAVIALEWFGAMLLQEGLAVVPAGDVRAVLERQPHCHSRPGVWDDDNRPEVAGTPCRECAARGRLSAALDGATPAGLAVVPASEVDHVETYRLGAHDYKHGLYAGDPDEEEQP